MQDPKGLLAAFDEFPTAKIKSAVALSMSFFNSMTNSFAEEDIVSLEKYLIEEDQEKLELLKDIDVLNPTKDEQEKLEELFPGEW